MQRPGDGDDVPQFAEPLDDVDPRFVGVAAGPRPDEARRLVRSRGPGPSPEEPYARILRVVIPLLFAAAVAVVGLVFFAGLSPGSQQEVLGPEAAVRAAVRQRPGHVCLRGRQPCAWLTLVDGELLAFNTNGPLPNEYGRFGVAWCATSGWYGSNVTGSRFDQLGRVVRGPAPRGLDRFAVHIDQRGRVVVDYSSLTTGLQAALTRTTLPPRGPDCDVIPFDRDAALRW